jgi:signal transduction histidine kinase/CheY-like chemotaxis protein
MNIEPASWPAREASAQPATADLALAAEQLDSLNRRGEVAVATAIAFALALALYLAPAVGWPLAGAWLALRCAVSGLRLLHVVACRSRGVHDVRRDVDRLHALLFVDGAVWGAAVLMVLDGSVPSAAIVACVVCCIACVGTFGLQQSMRATAAYVVPMLGIASLGMLGRADTTGLVGSVGLSFILFMMLRAAKTGEERFAEVQRLRMRDIEVAATAERHSQAKSTYMAALSHEVRGPIHGILGLAHLIDEASVDDTQRHYAQLIQRNGQHVLRLLNALLDHAKIEAGAMQLEAAPFDLRRDMAELLEVYAERARLKGIACEADLRLDGPTWVLGDCTRLRQVVENLLGNALKFTPTGGTIRLEVQRASAGYVLAVHDSGPGISAEDQARLFTPFTQVGDRSKAHQGAGLGLSISRDLCRLMGGQLECRSEPGAGATFIVTVPLPGAEPEPGTGASAPGVADPSPGVGVGPAARPAAAVAAGTPSFEAPRPSRAPAPQFPLVPLLPRPAPRRKVLIVDDDPVSGLISMAALQRAGWIALHVTSGELAIVEATEAGGRPAVVLMDFDMPGIGGLEATRAIRRWESEQRAPRVPVLGLSGRSTPADRAEALAAGMDDMMVKPAPMPELVARVAALARSPSEASAAPVAVVALAEAAGPSAAAEPAIGRLRPIQAVSTAA